MTKKKIRSKILPRLKLQKEENRSRKSKKIKDKLFRALVFKKAKRIMFYVAFGGEVNTEEMIKEARKLGKIIAVPASKKHRISIRPCILNEKVALERGPYGICQPVLKRGVSLKKLDLVVVPGVAFDKQGNRLGRGKGCYDRLLKRLPKDTPTIGLAFDFQVMPSVPTLSHDVGVHRVIFA